MILDNEITVAAAPDRVFALINDVERVVTCLPGASLEGGDGETYRGGVKVKVGPITAAYAGTVRFLEVDAARRHLRLQGRGADTHGSGDAEAEVILTVDEAPEGAVIRIKTDLLIRGKLVQFGKGAIVTVSNRLLDQFAKNLAALMEADHTDAPTPIVSGVGTAAPDAELNALSMLLPPSAAKYAPVAAAFAAGLVQGLLLGKLRAQSRELRELRRG